MLLLVGLILIVFAVVSIYRVYTGSSSPPSIFRMENQISIQRENETLTVEGISGEELSKVVNMGLWSVAMFFVALGGGKIAGLGVKLIRDIKVEVKRE